MLFNHKANTIKTFFFKIPCDCYLKGKKIFLAVATYYTIRAQQAEVNSSIFKKIKRY